MPFVTNSSAVDHLDADKWLRYYTIPPENGFPNVEDLNDPGQDIMIGSKILGTLFFPNDQTLKVRDLIVKGCLRISAKNPEMPEKATLQARDIFTNSIQTNHISLNGRHAIFFGSLRKLNYFFLNNYFEALALQRGYQREMGMVLPRRRGIYAK